MFTEKFPAFFPHRPQKQCGSSHLFVQNIVVSVHTHNSAQKGSSFIINLQDHLVLSLAVTTHQLSDCLRCCNRETCYCIKIVQLKLFPYFIRYHFDQEEASLLGRILPWRSPGSPGRSPPWCTGSMNIYWDERASNFQPSGVCDCHNAWPP